MTTLMPRSASRATLTRHRVGQREIDCHVGRRETAGFERICVAARDHAGDSGIVLAAPGFRSACPSGRDRRAARASDASGRRRLRREERGVQPSERPRQILLANHEGDVPARRRLRHHANRHVARGLQHLPDRATDPSAGLRPPRRRSPCHARRPPARTPTAAR